MKNQTIGIIGNGRFGNLLFQTFENHLKNTEIKIFSRKKIPDSKTFFTLEEVAACDIVIPAVPISEFESTVKRISKFLKPESLIIDVCSVSVHPAEVLLRNTSKNIDLLSTHPMFGPDSTKNGTTFENLKFIFKKLRVTNEERADGFLNFWKDLGCNLIELSPEEHDKQAAYTHAYAFLIGKIGVLMNIRRNHISTKGFEGLLYNQTAVENDTSQLFNDMMTYNPYVKQMIKDFGEAFMFIENSIHKI